MFLTQATSEGPWAIVRMYIGMHKNVCKHEEEYIQHNSKLLSAWIKVNEMMCVHKHLLIFHIIFYESDCICTQAAGRALHHPIFGVQACPLLDQKAHQCDSCVDIPAVSSFDKVLVKLEREHSNVMTHGQSLIGCM